MKLKRTALAALTAGILVLTAGCGASGGPEDNPFTPGGPGVTEQPTAPETPSTPEPPTAPVSGDACALLNGIDLQQLLSEPAEVDESSADTCNLIPTDPDGIGSIMVQMVNQHGKLSYEALKGIFGEEAPSAGIGDQSFINDGGMLYAVKGDRMLGLFVMRNPLKHDVISDNELRAAFEVIQRNAGW